MGPAGRGRGQGRGRGNYPGSKSSYDARKEQGHREQEGAPSDPTLDSSKEAEPVTQVGRF